MAGDKVCATTTTKDSLANTIAFVNYHFNIGVDHIYIFFDDPEDRVIEVLSKYEKVTYFKCDSKYWNKIKSQKELMIGVLPGKNCQKDLCLEERQQINASFALTLARRDGYDWIIHIDSDELIYSRYGLKKTLRKIKKNVDVLRMPSMEAVPEKLSYKNTLQEISLFKNFGAISRFYYKNKGLLQKFIPYFKRNEGKLKVRTMYFNGNAAGKSIVSTCANIKNIGLHEPFPVVGEKLTYYFPKGLSLLHFECKSFKAWREKWSRVCDNSLKVSEADTVLYFEKFSALYKKNDERGIYNLYKKNYFLPLYKKNILQFFGLLKRINLDKRLFSSARKRKG